MKCKIINKRINFVNQIKNNIIKDRIVFNNFIKNKYNFY